MRNDMDKVVVDRPRGGRSYAKSKKGSRRQRWKRNFESAPHRESTGRRRSFGYEAKTKDARLAPLKRWLDKQVGRPWDKVCSDANSFVRRLPAYLTDAHTWFVETDARISDCGTLVVPHRWSYNWEGNFTVDGRAGWTPLRGSRYRSLYVCPKTGILKKVP
jgi:hypothetical protein